MNCHYFVSARTGRRLLFRESEYTHVVKADAIGPRGFVLVTRVGGEYRVTTTRPVLIVEVDEPAAIAA